MLNHEEVKRREFTMPRLFSHTALFTHEMLTTSIYDDNKRLEMFTSGLMVVLEEREELMDVKHYGNLIFPIPERLHFYLVCFDLKNLAITVIDNMHPCESHVKKDVVVKFLKRVRHPQCYEIGACDLVRLEICWATIGNCEDCGIYAMRHMETWMGINEDRWDVGFPTEMPKAKIKIAQT
ncbi:putative papain-like cysteine peptidase superfamily [Helianthus anomalus]